PLAPGAQPGDAGAGGGPVGELRYHAASLHRGPQRRGAQATLRALLRSGEDDLPRPAVQHGQQYHLPRQLRRSPGQLCMSMEVLAALSLRHSERLRRSIVGPVAMVQELSSTYIERIGQHLTREVAVWRQVKMTSDGDRQCA